jgi:general secretion pathway protein E
MNKIQENKEALLVRLAEKVGLPVYVSLMDFPLIKKSEIKIPYLFAKENNIIPLEDKNDFVLVAISDPRNMSPIDELRLLLGKEIKPVFCLQKNLEEAIEYCYRQGEEETKKLFSQTSSKNVTDEKEIEDYDLLERSEGNTVVHMLNAIIIEAIQQCASDIHFDPQESCMRVRYRIDGILFDRFSPSREHQTQIITRIKVMSHLDIAENRQPQDGRIKLKMGQREIDFRVSIIPVIFGERVVLRILDRGDIFLGLNKLGMSETLLKQIKEIIQYPEGIILVTGPTGSGKTTTLYSAISELNAKEKNIMTIEEPVEFKLPQIAQISVNPKIDLTFSKGLRHVLRQDPDVIMIGEIRDKETAVIAIQSALTGHLVLSTLHTNDSTSSLTRLVDMGIEPYLLSSSVVAILAQRLVRKICNKCKYSYKPSAEELNKMGLSIKEKEPIKLFRSKGCSYCYGTGYKYRHGIYELLRITPLIKKQILKEVDSDKLRKIAQEQNMQELYQSGLDLIKKGITTYEEVLRVTRMVK